MVREAKWNMVFPRGQNAVVSAAGDTTVGNSLPPLCKTAGALLSDTLLLLAIMATAHSHLLLL